MASNDGMLDGAGDKLATVIPVHQEELRLSTKRVDTGRGLRVRKTVGERQQAVSVTLFHEELEVRRVPVGTIVAVAETPLSRYEGDTLIVPVLEEVLVVEKRIKIKEEIHITTVRRPITHEETVQLKKEELAIERFGAIAETPTTDP